MKQNLLMPTLSELADMGLDITQPINGVQVEVDHGRAVVYVHVDGVTVLRICRIPRAIEIIEHKGR